MPVEAFFSLLEDNMNFRKISMLLVCLGAAGAFYGCDSDSDMISGCKPGAYKCNGNTLQVCYGLNWSSINCPTGCDETSGVCKIPEGAECVIDTCKDETTVYKCTAGTKTEVACASGQTCVTGFGCQDSDSPDPNCTESSKRCNGQTLESCSNNAWTTVEFCEQGCDEANLVCKSVQPGEVCAGNTCKDDHTRIVCSDDKQSTSEEACGDDEKCSNGECVKKGEPVVTPDCSQDEVKCSEDNLGTISCKDDGTWDEVEACPEGQMCDIDQRKCIPEADAKVCNDNEIKCAGQAGVQGDTGYYECRDGKWAEDPSEFKKCPDGQICSQEDQKCIVNPAPECTADDIKCVDDKTYQVCDPTTGFWSTGIGNCEEGLVCDKTQNKCVPKAEAQCQKDEIKCADDASYYTCVDGSWSEKTTACGDDKYCDNKSNKCEDSCQADTYKCSDDMLSTLKCENHIWVEGTVCKDKQLCIEGSCKDVECTPGVDYCTGSGKSAGMYKCTKDGKKGDLIEYCASSVCLADGSACAECEDGKVQCTDKGVFQICIDGAWEDKVDCGSKDACSSSNTGYGKNYGCNCQVASGMGGYTTTQCNDDNSKIMACVTLVEDKVNIKYNGWEEKQDCGGANLCDDESNRTPYCKCKGTDYVCNGQTLQHCNNGRLVDDAVCGDNETCDAGKKACLCKEGAYQCVEKQQGHQKVTVRQYCNAGKWIDKECGKSQTCVDNGFCASADILPCKENAMVCNGNAVMKCNADGIYVQTEDCGSTGICTEHNNGQASCDKVSDKCDMMDRDNQRCFNGKIQTCKGSFGSYKWEETGACGEKQICVEVTTGWGMNQSTKAECQDKKCDDYKFTCEKDIIMYCNNNALLTYGDCGEIGMTCKDDSMVCIAK